MYNHVIRSLFLIVSCLLLTPYLPAQTKSLQAQRTAYFKAKEALDKGNPLIYYSNKELLNDYVLEPYLAYADLSLRLPVANDQEVLDFIRDHADLPQIKWLEMRWLRKIAIQGDWPLFLKYYKANHFSELDCLYGQYLYQNKYTDAANRLAKKLWLKGYSQPNSCDALFNQWQKLGGLSNDMYWKRLVLALEAKQYRLGTHLMNQLSGNYKEQAKRFIDVAQKPELLDKTAQFQNKDSFTADIVGLGLRRLARQNPDNALTLLDYYSKRLHFTTQHKADLANDIGLTLARRFDPRALPLLEKYDPQLKHNDVSEWRARLLLRTGRWQQAHALILQFPDELSKHSRWKYWKARTLELSNPNDKSVNEWYQSLATERDFYGFLAAQHINAPYRFNDSPIIVNNNAVLKIKNSPAMQRIFELQTLELDKELWVEWNHATRFLSREELLAFAQLQYDLQMYFSAIRTLAAAEYWDDLNIRFPIAHRKQLETQAQKRNIDPTWAFAIMRQESAFKANIKSYAGAMGLMQLMPGTAKETAKKFDIPLAKVSDALDPDTNIQLGNAFLGQMYTSFQNNRILASAAYNAGPGRVRQWLKNSSNLDFDVWIETIPFNETRQYVQNVLFYSVIYGYKLDKPRHLIDKHERSFN